MAPDVLELGRILYLDRKAAFEAFIQLHSTDPAAFKKRYGTDAEELGSKPYVLELLYIFGQHERQLLDLDWKGEESPEETEAYFEERIGPAIIWDASRALRASVPEDLQRDGKFILKLFKAVDKDLGASGHRLLFFKLPWDSYVLIPIATERHEALIRVAPDHFEGVDQF